MYLYSEAFQGNAIFESSGLFVTDEPWQHASRIVHSYELILVITGALPIEVAGNRYDIQPNEVLIIPPETHHTGYKKTAGVRFIWIHFRLEDITQLPKDDAFKLSIEEAQEASTLLCPLYSDKLDMHRLFLMTNQLLDIYQEKVPQSYLNNYMNAVLYEISYQTIRIIKQVQITGNDMQPIQDWIRIHAFEEITLQQIANYFNYNKNYLSRKYKEIVGIGIAHQIAKYRINQAKFLLSDTTLTIQEIANEVGYEDAKYFMRIFKRMESNTPSDYRKAFNKRHYNKE